MALDLPQRGIDDNHWDLKLNAALVVLDAQVQSALSAASDASSAAFGVTSTASDALSTAQAASAAVAALAATVTSLQQAVANLNSLTGLGSSSLVEYAKGNVTRPSADPTQLVIWEHNAEPDAMLDGDLFINVP